MRYIVNAGPHCHTKRWWFGKQTEPCECITLEHLLGRQPKTTPPTRRRDLGV